MKNVRSNRGGSTKLGGRRPSSTPLRTRLAALLTALTLAAGGAWVLAEGDFPDVPDDHPRAEAIQWAASEDLFRGFLDGNFRPDQELTEGQFNKVVKRLFDRYDSWTRAETAAFMWRGAEADHAPGDTPTTRAPAPTSPPEADCAWPLGEPHWIGDPYTSFRFPITEDCGSAYVVRVEDQSFNVRAGADFTPGFQWRRDWTIARMDVRWNGNNLGSRQVAADSITTTTTTAPPSTTTTTTLPRPAVTLPDPLVPAVPYAQRDLVFHWFKVPRFVPAGYEDRNSPLREGISGLVVYLADPGGPHPGVGREITLPFFFRYVSPVNGYPTRSAGMPLYQLRTDDSAIAYSRTFGYGQEEHAEKYLPPSEGDFTGDTMGRFKSVTFAPVTTPVSEECRLAWLGFENVRDESSIWREEIRQTNAQIKDFPQCHPREWRTWWGKYSE